MKLCKVTITSLIHLLSSMHSSLSQGQHLHSVTTDGRPFRLAIVDVTATHSWQVAATLDGEEIAMLEVAQHYVTVKVSKVHAKRYNLCQHTPFTFKHTYTNIYYFSFTINTYLQLYNSSYYTTPSPSLFTKIIQPGYHCVLLFLINDYISE